MKIVVIGDALVSSATLVDAAKQIQFPGSDEQIEFKIGRNDHKKIQCSNTRIIDQKVEGWCAIRDNFVNFSLMSM